MSTGTEIGKETETVAVSLWIAGQPVEVLAVNFGT
jgi:hypothetical protein